MKRQFAHESHRRQDKVYKADYRAEMQLHPRLTPPPTGADHHGNAGLEPTAKLDAATCNAIKYRLLLQIESWFFVYGSLAYKHRQQLSEFAMLNNLSAEDPRTVMEKQRLESLFQADLPLMRDSIRRGKVRQHKGWLRSCVPPYVDWAFPRSASADLVSRKFPREYLKEIAKASGAANAANPDTSTENTVHQGQQSDSSTG